MQRRDAVIQQPEEMLEVRCRGCAVAEYDCASGGVGRGLEQHVEEGFAVVGGHGDVALVEGGGDG